MKQLLLKWLVILSPIIITVIALVTSYQESWLLMRGDLEFSRWMWLQASNKNWLLLICLAAIGGSIAYIVYKVSKKFLVRRKV